MRTDTAPLTYDCLRGVGYMRAFISWALVGALAILAQSMGCNCGPAAQKVNAGTDALVCTCRCGVVILGTPFCVAEVDGGVDAGRVEKTVQDADCDLAPVPACIPP